MSMGTNTDRQDEQTWNYMPHHLIVQCSCVGSGYNRVFVTCIVHILQQPQMTSPTKQVSSMTLCKHGQEINQELVNRLLEVFKQFKTMQVISVMRKTPSCQCYSRKIIGTCPNRVHGCRKKTLGQTKAELIVQTCCMC